MEDSYHVYPCSSRPSIGHHIIELVVSDPLFSIKDGIHVWNGNAPEQLEALVISYLQSVGVSEDEIGKLK